MSSSTTNPVAASTATKAELIAERDGHFARIAQIDAEIKGLEHAGKKDAIATVRRMLSENGLTVDDLQGVKAEKVSCASGAPHAGQGTKVAAKYKDDAGNAWSGRGLKPKWLTAAIATGRRLEEFAV